MQTLYPSTVIADTFLDLADSNQQTLTSMQVLKLVYIAHGWSLGLLGRALTGDEIQAWQYGPVIPLLYDKIREFRGKSVRGPLYTGDPVTIDERSRKLIEKVFATYGVRSGFDLSRITHAPGTPWTKVYREGTFGLRISDDLIEHHYRSLVGEAA
ncbi:MAG: type II toxin-antitoxin system antitoxin SocA domain-containing protein [Pseudomonadota bacterium]